LQAGKPVYVEKPMALTGAGAQRMKQYAESSNGKLAVAHYRRELPLFKKVKQLISEDVLGNIRFVNLKMLQPHNAPLITQTADNWRVDPAVAGGGLFHDLAPHQLDLMIYFFGAVDSAVGQSANQGGYYQADDIVQGMIHFKNNIFFNGLWCFTVPPGDAQDICEIIGTKGKMVFSIFRHDKLMLTLGDETEEQTFEVPAHVQQPMIEKVVKYFGGVGDNPCPATDGVEVMRLIDLFTLKNVR
jgi:predicted dehydrogenase